MNITRLALSAILTTFLLMSAVLPAAAQDEKSPMSEQKTLAQVLQDRDQFSALVNAVEKAELTNTLETDGPFTVLAPTNDAFAALDDSVESMSAEKLRALLRSHLLSGSVSSSQAVTAGRAQTLQGDTLSIEQSGESVMIENATVVTPDIKAENGVIHVIDAVLMSSEDAAGSMSSKK